MGVRRYTDLQLACAIAESRNMRELLPKLGLVACGSNYETVRRRISELGLSTEHFKQTQRHIAPAASNEEIAHAVASSRSYAQILVKLGEPLGGANYKWIQKKVRELALDTSHLMGKAANRGRTLPSRGAPIAEVLVSGRPCQSNNLKQRLIREGLKAAACERCGIKEWEGKRLSFELHHVNGDRSDNRLENLEILCPNCHSQTRTYRGRNIGSAETSTMDSYP